MTAGLHNAKDDVGRMKVFMAVAYKEGMVYVRMIDKDLFIWDAVYKGQLYSSYLVITPEEGKPLSNEAVKTACDMCYAGAAATIDNMMGVKLTEEDERNIQLFEDARKQVEGIAN